MKKACLSLLCGVLLAGSVPAVAHAQTFITPFAGVTMKGDAPDEQLTTGASLTFMGNVVGFEFDFGYTPDFFGEDSGVVLVGDSNVTTFTGNILIGLGAGPIRPYVLGGVGLLRSRVEVGDLFEDVTSNDLGLSAGGGVVFLLGNHVGLRADVRYFRSLEDPDGDDDVDLAVGNFDFWRGTGGLILKF